MKGKKFLTVMAGLIMVALLALTPGMAMASVVGPGAFVGGLTEGFEGISPNTGNTGGLEYGNFFSIGTTTTPYIFSSGISLTNPIPALSVAAGGPYIEDFVRGGGINDWGINGSASTAPFGTAYIGFYAATTFLEFTMPENMTRVGAYVTGRPGIVTMSIYNGANLIESHGFTIGSVANWGTAANFMGLESSGQDITRVIFSNADIGLDGLRANVPIPPSAFLLGTGLLGLLGIGWSRNRKEETTA